MRQAELTRADTSVGPSPVNSCSNRVALATMTRVQQCLERSVRCCALARFSRFASRFEQPRWSGDAACDAKYRLVRENEGIVPGRFRQSRALASRFEDGRAWRHQRVRGVLSASDYARRPRIRLAGIGNSCGPSPNSCSRRPSTAVSTRGHSLGPIFSRSRAIGAVVRTIAPQSSRVEE